jgi:acetyl esterase/lipase
MRQTNDEKVLAILAHQPADDLDVEEIKVGGVDVFIIHPPEVDPRDRRVYLEMHGGGFFMGGGACCLGMGIFTATRVGLTVWTPDYRLPPEHPYPASLDDCLSVYRTLLDRRHPNEIIVSGASSGANLAAALILRARDEGCALPAAAVLLSGQLDLTHSGDSFHTNLGVDTVLSYDPMPCNLVYAGDHCLSDPYLSPLFGDFTPGFPPTLLTSGTRDLLLSSTVRMHRALRAAGVAAELHVFEASPHGGFMADTPEDEDLEAEVRGFVAKFCPPP